MVRMAPARLAGAVVVYELAILLECRSAASASTLCSAACEILPRGMTPRGMFLRRRHRASEPPVSGTQTTARSALRAAGAAVPMRSTRRAGPVMGR